ncbi:hypothetical protein IW146_007305 [Coemansia sp. RSA 922]|nr:hypothetical protein H4S03_002746 [Coemansia sp. S3946]KAJ2049377.1 hypothetical protein H4S04_003265 [Coemansia sp. S16]KAJ2107462.1 hypothetical protein IW146_007305 [Coemansia sp. RSA 922]
MNAAATTAQPSQEASLFVGENLDVVIPPDRLYDHSDKFCLQKLCRRNSSAVCKLATPYDPALSTMAGKLARKIAADLETRLSMAAQRREPYATYGGETYYNYPPRAKRGAESLDDWAMDILKWTNYSVSTASAGSRHINDSMLTDLEADSVAPSYEAFFLFVAHYVKAHISGMDANGLKSEDCRLILPITKNDTDDDNTNVYVVGRDDSTEFSNVECGLFPLSSCVERQTMSAPHLIVANVEIVRHLDFFYKVEPKLVRKTKELFPNQHNRRFAWGLAASCHTVHAYVFGPDDIWQSSKIDVSGSKGRRELVSLLVDWSLCSVDRLGFDPTIRYVVDGNTGGTYLEIDVYETGKCTGQMEKRTYYSKRCIRAAEIFTGRHGRYFAASTSPEMLNTPEFLVKDMWAISTSGSTSDTHESSFLNVLHAEFDQSSEFSGRFSQLVTTGSVYLSQRDTLVTDSTVTAFAGLPTTTQDATNDSDAAQISSRRCVRHHRRTVLQWVGNPVSAADNPNQIVVAIADAMVALNEAHVKGKILHGNISDRAILFQKTVDGVKGVLGEFDYAFYSGDSAVESPELMLFQSVHRLENAGTSSTRLDDWESILYLLCWLGTFGINPTQRREYAEDYAAKSAADKATRYTKQLTPVLPILDWIQRSAIQNAQHKRLNLSAVSNFRSSILLYMRENSPLRPLALDLYRSLFLHPGCYGVTLLTDDHVAEMEDGDIPAALREIPSINGCRDPLNLRDTFENEIVANLLRVLAEHKQVALVALRNATSVAAGVTESDNRAEISASATPAKKSKRNDEPYDGPAKRTRSKATRSAP